MNACSIRLYTSVVCTNECTKYGSHGYLSSSLIPRHQQWHNW